MTRAAVAAALLALTVPCSAPADPGPASGALPGGSDLVQVRTANLQHRGVLTIRVAGEFYESLDASDVLGEGVSGEYTTIRLGARYGVTTWLETCADIPARRASWSDVPGGSVDLTGMDAPVVGVKLGVPTGSSLFRVAASARVGLPLGDRGEG